MNTPEAPKNTSHTRRVVVASITLVIYLVIAFFVREYFEPVYPAQEAYKRGLDAEGKKDYDLAIAEYTEAIRLGPNDNYNYYFSRAQSYMFNTGEYDKAIADYKDAIRLGDSYVFHYAIGDCYMKLDDYANAISYYEQSLQRNPNNSEVKKKLETAKEKAR